MRAVIFGGTGFVGKHLLDRLPPELSDSEVIIVSRNPPSFSLPQCAKWVRWDVLSNPPDLPDFNFAVHAATSTLADLYRVQPDAMYEAITAGMRGVIEVCRRQKIAPRLLFTSSGAVYGEMGKGKEFWFEQDAGPRSPSLTAYARGKLEAEYTLFDNYSRDVCRPTVARLFAFGGRHLPLTRHFALGNFVGDAVGGGPIRIRGDGRCVRSYLDGDDMADWLWSALVSEVSVGRTFNVGSERAVQILDLAHLVAQVAEQYLGSKVHIEVQGILSEIDGFNRYVPSTRLIREVLAVDEKIDLTSSIEAMMKHHLRIQKRER